MTTPRVGAAYEGWPDDARSLVERAITAHGGLARWRAVKIVRVSLASLSGMIPAMKGYGRTFASPGECEVRPHERSTIFHGYPGPDHRGIFVDGDVSIESLEGGGTTIESRGHRRTFDGFAKNRRWNHLDALYFFGYALWHYHAVPFTLGNARFVKALRGKGTLRGVEVEFGAEIQTHCRRQRFFFAEDGRIERHDYVAEVVGPWARGCHFWERYQTVGGLQIACRRRVVFRLLGQPTPFTVLLADLTEPRVED